MDAVLAIKNAGLKYQPFQVISINSPLPGVHGQALKTHRMIQTMHTSMERHALTSILAHMG